LNKMKTQKLFQLLAVVAIAAISVNSFAQATFQVVQGDVKTYTANINAVGHPAAGITFSWALSGTPGGASAFVNSNLATQTVTWDGGPGVGYVLTVTPTLNCSFPLQAQTATIEILSNTIDIAWTAPGTTTVCSQTALSNTIGVTATGLTFATGNTYTLEYQIDGGALLNTNVTYVNGATTGTVDFSATSFTNTTAANVNHTIVITRLRVNAGAWVNPADHTYTATVTPEPVLNAITSN
jgi:hypothetical protein